MTEKEFVYWLKGFVAGCEGVEPSPADYKKIVKMLEKVSTSINQVDQFDEDIDFHASTSRPRPPIMRC